MYNEKRELIFHNYSNAKSYFIANYAQLIAIEAFVTEIVNNTIVNNLEEIVTDYNEASYLQPFWANYPPDDRGRAPVGDQIPWIEVGEHAVGHKLSRLISLHYDISEVGLPSGADNRFVLKSKKIEEISNGITDKAFVFLDIKSVGPRDNFDHTVISPYQVSGDGKWDATAENMHNSTMQATGHITSHTFYPAISPIYALSDGSIAPTIHLFVKPVYKMMCLVPGKTGQPLESIKNVCIPNGLLLTNGPNYLEKYPKLFFPGKDDKKTNPQKIRVRVSFDILRSIASWRFSEFRI